MNLNVRLYLVFIILILSKNGFSEQQEIDSLKNKIAVAGKADTNLVNTLNELALAYYTANKPEKVRVYSAKAIILSQQLKYINGEALAFRRLSSLYMDDNANPLALNYLNRAYKLYRTANDNLNSARVMTNIGVYYHEIKDYSTALDYFKAALQEAKKLERAGLEIVLYSDIGDIYERNGEFEKAQKNYNEALELAIRSKNTKYLAFCYSNLGSVNLKIKKYAKALNFCNKAINANKANSGDAKDLAETYLTQARVHLALRNYILAEKLLQQSDVLTRQTRNIDDKLQIYHEYYLLDSVRRDYKSALSNYYRYNRLHDSVVNVNKNRIVALYNVRFETQKREDENKRLRIAEEKNQLVISKQHTIQAGLLIGLIIIICGLFYLKRINNQVEAKNKIIKEQNVVLENSNMVKDKLFSVISHDLRSPIAHVISVFNLWESGAMNASDMSTVTPIIKGHIINTLELLDNLLIWSKNQLHGFNFNPIPFDLHKLAADTIYDLENHIQQKKLHVINSVLAGMQLYADREMVKIVLRNLITNAIKFTPHNGSIRINSYEEHDQIVISVTDSGMGIKEEDKEKIFSFTTHTTLGTNNEKGTGIGLRICRDFIEINKGKIWMESDENMGSTFYISFPRGLNNRQYLKNISLRAS